MKNVMFALFALSATVFAASHKVTLFQPTVVGGVELRAGEYKMDVENGKMTLRSGKVVAEASVREAEASKKFDSTATKYMDENGKMRLKEVRIGGTTKQYILTVDGVAGEDK